MKYAPRFRCGVETIKYSPGMEDEHSVDVRTHQLFATGLYGFFVFVGFNDTWYYECLVVYLIIIMFVLLLPLPLCVGLCTCIWDGLMLSLSERVA